MSSLVLIHYRNPSTLNPQPSTLNGKVIDRRLRELHVDSCAYIHEEIYYISIYVQFYIYLFVYNIGAYIYLGIDTHTYTYM